MSSRTVSNLLNSASTSGQINDQTLSNNAVLSRPGSPLVDNAPRPSSPVYDQYADDYVRSPSMRASSPSSRSGRSLSDLLNESRASSRLSSNSSRPSSVAGLPSLSPSLQSDRMSVRNDLSNLRSDRAALSADLDQLSMDRMASARPSTLRSDRSSIRNDLDNIQNDRMNLSADREQLRMDRSRSSSLSQRLASNRVASDRRTLQDDLDFGASAAVIDQDLAQLEDDRSRASLMSSRTPSMSSRASSMRSRSASMRERASSMRTSPSVLKSDTMAVNSDLDRLEDDMAVKNMDLEMAKSDRSAMSSRPLAEMLSQRRERSSSRFRSGASDVYDMLQNASPVLLPTEEKLSTVTFSNATMTAEGDSSADVKVMSMPTRKMGKAIEDYKEELRTIKVTVLSVTKMEGTDKKIFLLCVNERGTKFYVKITTFDDLALYLPENHLTLTKFAGSKTELSDRISMAECANLSTCDVLYTCDNEVCYLRHDGMASMQREDYVMANEELSNKTLHSSNSPIGRPVVSLEELMGNPRATLMQIEISAEMLYQRALMNIRAEILNVTRKLSAAAFDSVNVQNLFINTGVNFDLNAKYIDQQLPALEAMTDPTGMKMRDDLVAKLYKVKCGEEALLTDAQGLDDLMRLTNMIMDQLRVVVDRMRVTYDSFNPDDGPYRNSEAFASAIQSDEILKKGSGVTTLTINL